MEPLLFDQSLQKLNVLYKYSGMNLHNKIKTPKDTIKHRWLLTINCLPVIIACILAACVINVEISKGKTILEVTSIAPCVAFTILAMLKSGFHMYHEKTVQELIQTIRNFEIEMKNKGKSIKDEDSVKKEITFLNLVVNVLYVLNCMMIIVFDATPLILIAIKYFKTKEFEMLLPYLNVFVFLPRNYMYWVLNYINQIWSEVVVLLEMGASDLLFFTCCTYIRVHFKVLQNDLKNIVGNKYTESHEMEITDLVRRHQVLINVSVMLETIYSKSMLFNFLVSSLVICLTGFNVAVVSNIEVVIIFLTFLSMSLMQIFFLCLFSDLLMNASSEVCDAIYNSQWYSNSVRLKRLVLIMQIRAQKPCQVTTAGFSIVNLRAFMKVLSTSWSYFALLRTMYSR